MKKVLLINQGKTENLGDKAINVTFKKLLEEQGCFVDTIGFAQTNEQFLYEMKITSKNRGKSFLKKLLPSILIWFFKYRKKIKQEFINLKNEEYDLVVIGGGQLIKTKTVFVYVLMSWISIIKKNLTCPIVMIGVGSDEHFTLIERLIYRRSLSKLKEIYVRDELSKTIIKNESNLNAKYIPDVVFAYSRLFQNLELEEKKGKLSIMIYDFSALKRNFGSQIDSINEYFSEWKELIINNYENDLEIVLIYTTIGDKEMTYRFAEYLRKETTLVFSIQNTDTIEELMYALNSTKILISGRMHGMLLGLNCGCKIIPYEVSPKINSFKTEWLDEDFDIKKVNDKIYQTLYALLSS